MSRTICQVNKIVFPLTKKALSETHPLTILTGGGGRGSETHPATIPGAWEAAKVKNFLQQNKFVNF